MPPITSHPLIQEFSKYVLVGICSTIMDWGSFNLVVVHLHVAYLIGMTLSYTLGTLTHYTLNRLITFNKMKTTQAKKQLAIYLTIVGISFVLNLVLMSVMVSGFKLPLMFSRVLTTGLMLVVNYSLHKTLTFNHRIYRSI